jgi:glucose/mannose-6-phosphate isomerase
MKITDNIQEIQKVDPSQMQRLLENFDVQLEEALRIGESIRIDAAVARGARNLVFTGLGGSAIGADVIRGYVQNEIGLPVLVNRGYTLPGFVNPDTLLVVSSYSGNTEETISSYREGKRRKARVVTISSGGEIEKMARQFGDPHIKIPTGFPPRAALGYSVFPLLLLLDRLGLVLFKKQEFDETLAVIRRLRKVLGPESSGPNEAKELADLFYRRYPLFYSASDHFEAVALRWRGQIEENAKALASHHVLPEMNHNEIVGWKNPEPFLKDLVAVFLRDSGEHARVQIRMRITRELVEKTGAKTVQVRSEGSSLLARIFSLIYKADFVSFYLAVLYGVDPTAVKVIDYLKGELAKEKMPE